ncbi:AbrB/MazE/SpoVT family DNA-binding domain-containing protein [Fictibacillus sp. WQ 8-8]|uniref:AbrB/MazE/SpoVT family DNA-binding domain-containing protein n=1 Tax=Fictibacillus sp. WQ 8-8 TaxID=2938788 RepID=UPI00210AA869|nr:AbrB/MazE/SpoVT family DNA-binding domain-containing protein [Fictibacillus sp. WQ 8-8]MCQ6268394.1 AbrB/MazE/SpoVT family DNA-binding domain-containing protein [Fictibacillus sp. WQ 8-8]
MEKDIKIRKVGNSLGVIIPFEMLKNLGVGEDDLVRMTYDNGKIIITNNPESSEAKFKERIFRIIDEYMKNER